MSKLLIGSIDLNKIEKAKIVTTDKNGQPFQNGAKYINVAVWVNDEADQYGNHASIQQSVSKEEREQGKKATYIGNLKQNQSQSQEGTVQVDLTNSDDLPF